MKLVLTFNGRDAPAFNLFGFHFTSDHPASLVVFGVVRGPADGPD